LKYIIAKPKQEIECVEWGGWVAEERNDAEASWASGDSPVA